MARSIFNIIKAAIISIIVAFLFVLIISLFLIKVGKEKFEMATNLLDIITISKEVQTITPVLEGDVLLNYPTYGSKYATIKIPTIDVELPVYYGETYNILKSGVAHQSVSYFPGEGGSILMAGHNFKSFLARLPEAKIGDIITLETTYGTFDYEIYDTKIVSENDTFETPIQKEKEVLYVYTCWPINNIGHASQRYMVYADLVKAE